jgi:hypothetical protein
MQTASAQQPNHQNINICCAAAKRAWETSSPVRAFHMTDFGCSSIFALKSISEEMPEILSLSIARDAPVYSRFLRVLKFSQCKWTFLYWLPCERRAAHTRINKLNMLTTLPSLQATFVQHTPGPSTQ